MAKREARDSEAIAGLAVELRDEGVIGFDLAGPERGFPPGGHASACRVALGGGIGLTIHAGEGDGPSSIADALACGAQRLGHGVRIIEDCKIEEGEVQSMGPLARRIRDARIPLELCVLSNVHTGIAPSPAQHPVGALYRAGFAVTVNTDNRLMSRTSMNKEFRILVSVRGFGLEDLRVINETALEVAFCGSDLKRELLEERIRPSY